MKPILEFSNISKKYHLTNHSSSYVSLRDSIASFFSRSKSPKSEFYALKDVNYEVFPGDSVGIIGRNGAGKSTLLKIISKITPPTSGKIISRGRIASLLEVGTGFHPELTGKENIFLNGSILGMKRREIIERVDEIIDFSGVEKFLNLPLKHYSSGMQLRLAFSVAAFLNPEILVIDEVLAVGDSVFQKKCIDKMSEVCKSGRTILFVSHNFSAVKALCNKAFVLQEGTKVFEGGVNECIEFYNNDYTTFQKEIDLGSIRRKQYDQGVIYENLCFDKPFYKFGDKIGFSIKLKKNIKDKVFRDLDFGISIRDKYNNCIIHLSNRFINSNFDHSDDNCVYLFEFENILKPGTYRLTLFLRAEDRIQDYLFDIVPLTIEDGNPYNYSNTENIQGSILPNFNIQQLSTL